MPAPALLHENIVPRNSRLGKDLVAVKVKRSLRKVVVPRVGRLPVARKSIENCVLGKSLAFEETRKFLWKGATLNPVQMKNRCLRRQA
jgi:hypothetical protein